MDAGPCTPDDDHAPGDPVLALLWTAALSMAASLTVITLIFVATGTPGEALALAAIAAGVLAVSARPHPRPARDSLLARDAQRGGSTLPAPEPLPGAAAPAGVETHLGTVGSRTANGNLHIISPRRARQASPVRPSSSSQPATIMS